MSDFWHLGWETLRRKLQRSLRQRGWGATGVRCLVKPLEWAFDRLYQVETRADFEALRTAQIDSANWMHDAGYAPAPIADIRAILESLPIDVRDFVFIDFGAGKGRMLLLAAELPFKRIVGVEFSPALFEILERNLATYRNPQRRCHNLSGMLQDATQFPLPAEPLVLLFHHPFGAPVFEQMIERIEQSLSQTPREVWVIYYDPQCARLFDECGQFERWREGKRNPTQARSDDWIVFVSRSATLFDVASKAPTSNGGPLP